MSSSLSARLNNISVYFDASLSPSGRSLLREAQAALVTAMQFQKGHNKHDSPSDVLRPTETRRARQCRLIVAVTDDCRLGNSLSVLMNVSMYLE